MSYSILLPYSSHCQFGRNRLAAPSEAADQSAEATQWTTDQLAGAIHLTADLVVVHLAVALHLVLLLNQPHVLHLQ